MPTTARPSPSGSVVLSVWSGPAAGARLLAVDDVEETDHDHHYAGEPDPAGPHGWRGGAFACGFRPAGAARCSRTRMCVLAHNSTPGSTVSAGLSARLNREPRDYRCSSPVV